MTFIGVDIGGTKCSAVLDDENGNIFTYAVSELLK